MRYRAAYHCLSTLHAAKKLWHRLADIVGDNVSVPRMQDYKALTYHVLSTKNVLAAKTMINSSFREDFGINCIRMYYFFKSTGIYNPEIEILLALKASRAMVSSQASLRAFRLLRPYFVDTDTYLTAVRRMKMRSSLIASYARSCLRAGQQKEFLEACDTFIHVFKRYWNGHYFLAINASSSNDQAYLNHMKNAQDLSNKMDCPAYTLLVDANIRCGDIDGAIDAFAAGRKFHPECPDLLLSRMAIENIGLNYTGGFKFFREYFTSYGLDLPNPKGNNSFDGCLGSADFSLPDFLFPGDPKVTVIITCYNRKNQLDTAIKSVLSQTYKNIELIIIDDNSMDGSVEKIKEWQSKDNRVDLITKDKNEGTYVSKNRAILESSGEFVTFLDSDDWMHPRRIECHLKHTCANTAMSISEWIRITDDFMPAVRLLGGFTHRNLCSMFIRRKVFDKVGYFDSVRAGADSEFFRRIRAVYGRQCIWNIAMPLSLARLHGSSITTSGVAATDENNFSPVRLEYCDSWSKWHYKTSPGELKIPFPHNPRGFEAPEEILVPDVTD